MKRIFPLSIVGISCFCYLILAAPEKKGKRTRILTIENTLPADNVTHATFSWHKWTSTSGETLEAKYRTLENGILTVETRENKIMRFPLARLNQEDQRIAQACKIREPRPQLAQSLIDSASANLDHTINTALKAGKSTPNAMAPDAVFLRRLYLDTIGRIPTAEEAQAFLADSSPSKRSTLINSLLNSPGYTMHMFNWLADMLRVKDDYGKGAKAYLYEDWLKEQIAMNISWDRIVHDMLVADGKLNGNGAAGFLLRDAQMPLDGVSNMLTTFLGANVACAQCHDHPFAEWSQHDFYSLSAYFGATDGYHEKVFRKIRQLQKSDELAHVNRQLLNQILGSNPYHLVDLTKNKLRFPEDYKYKDAAPGELTKPALIRWADTKEDNPAYLLAESDSQQPRNQFANWMVHPENPRFATAIANRLWKKAFGIAVQEPISDIDDPREASNPELLSQITTYMKQAKFNLREFQRILFHTAAYQRIASNVPEDPKTYLFAGPVIRRMTAEQAWDSVVCLAIGSEADQILLRRGDLLQQTNLKEDELTPAAVEALVAEMKSENPHMNQSGKKQGKNRKFVKNGKRAAFYEGGVPLQSNGLILARASETPQPAPESHFLRLFGQSDRLVADSNTVDGSVPQLLQLMNGPVQELITKNSLVIESTAKASTTEEKITSLYLSFLSRYPRNTEIAHFNSAMNDGLTTSDLAWVLLNSREFLFLP